MSLITVQVGQCGNQVGSALFNTLARDIECSANLGSGKKQSKLSSHLGQSRFFRSVTKKANSKQVLLARSVLVDMERKVVERVLNENSISSSQSWAYDKQMAFCSSQGSGNNWAYGYSVHGPRSWPEVSFLIRKELERIDHPEGVVLLMSSAGGTGSGLGAFLVEALADEHADLLSLVHLVCPYNRGEVVIQNYNTLLTVTSAVRHCNALLISWNDLLHKIAQKRFLVNEKRMVTLDDMNKVVAEQLAHAFSLSWPMSWSAEKTTPAYDTMADDTSALQAGQSQRPNRLGYLLQDVTPLPQLKLLGLVMVPQMTDLCKPFSSYTWPALIKYTRQALISNSGTEEGICWQVKPNDPNCCRSFANVLTLRGYSASAVNQSRSAASGESVHGNIADFAALCPPEISDLSFKTYTSQRPFLLYEKSCSLLSNSQMHVPNLRRIRDKAALMYEQRAFVHHYTRYGFEEADFDNRFQEFDSVLERYDQATF